MQPTGDRGAGFRSPRRLIYGFASSGINGRLIFGLMIITLGAVFTLDNLGLVDGGQVLRWWPAALVVYGLARLTGFGCRINVTAGLLFTLAGGWMLLHNLHYIRWDIWDLWPALLVVIGGSMVAGALRRRSAAVNADDAASTINSFAMMAGVDHKVTARDFRGGQVTAIMAGHDIDLRSAQLADGTAIIELRVCWGGVDFRVPEDWKVSCQALPLMGGVEDHSKPPAGEVKGHLILKGLVVMGGVEIKN